MLLFYAVFQVYPMLLFVLCNILTEKVGRRTVCHNYEREKNVVSYNRTARVENTRRNTEVRRTRRGVCTTINVNVTTLGLNSPIHNVEVNTFQWRERIGSRITTT